MAMTHLMNLAYTTDDDGVHLECSCGFDLNLGFDASPVQAYLAALEHHPASVIDEMARQVPR
jgi:hypothetical protein